MATGGDINALNFRYRIAADSPAWRPLPTDAAAEGDGGRLASGAVVNFTP